MSSHPTSDVAQMRRRLVAIDELLIDAETQLQGLVSSGESPQAAPQGVPPMATATATPPPPPPQTPAPQGDEIWNPGATAKQAGAPGRDVWSPGATAKQADAPVQRPAGPNLWSRTVDLGAPRLLAIAGGIALLAGLVFLFVLASQNGILGPTGRVLIGAAASAGLVGVGLWLESRRSGLIAAQVTIGVGIAGLYTAIVTASRHYELISSETGLVLGGLVAAGAVVISLRWRSELIAIFGIVGALLAPPTLDAGLSAAGVAFAIILAGAALALWLREGWEKLAMAAAGISGVYAATLIGGAWFEDVREVAWNPYWQAVCGVGAYWGLLTAAWIVRAGRGVADQLNVRVLLGGAGLALIAARVMFDDQAAGIALLLVAAAYAVIALAVRPLALAGWRALSLASGLVALAAFTLALLEMLGGANLAIALGLEGIIIGLVALRERSHAIEIAAGVHAALAAVATLVIARPLASLLSFPPDHLLDASGTALDGGLVLGAVGSLIVTAVAVAVVAAAVIRRSDNDDRVLAWIAAAVGLVAVAVAVIDVALLADLSRGTFQFAHVLVSGIWSLVALAALWFGLTRDRYPLRVAGLSLLAATVAKLVLFDLSELTALARVSSFIVVGALLIVGSIFYQRLAREEEAPRS